MRQLLKNISKYCYWQHNFKRKNFNVVEGRDIEYFRSFMPRQNVVTDLEEIAPHNLCFRKLDKGDSKLLLFPQNTE